jgi:hypothetical protein
MPGHGALRAYAPGTWKGSLGVPTALLVRQRRSRVISRTVTPLPHQSTALQRKTLVVCHRQQRLPSAPLSLPD